MGTYFAATSRHWPFDAALSAADVPITGVEPQPEPSPHCYRGRKFVPARFIVTARIGSCVGPPASNFPVRFVRAQSPMIDLPAVEESPS
jgi:hypothetical protein